MAIGETLPSHARAVGGGWRPALGAAMLAVSLGLGACSPVEAWRDLNGAGKNDPNPATTPNTRNLAAGEASGYPNLATVPPPPTQMLTADELGKLAQSLTADRTNLRSTDQKLRADVAEIAPPAPPPPAGPQDTPPAATIRSATATPSTDRAAPAAAAAGPRKAEQMAGRVVDERAAPAAEAAGPRKAGQLPEPGPMESSLVSPEIRVLPQPEQFQPAPPPPHLAAAPAPRLPPAAPPQLSAAPAAPPYQPPPPPPPMAMLAPAKTVIEPPAPAISTLIGEIGFAPGTTGFSDSARRTIDEVAARYKRNPAKLRIVGYAAAGGGAAAELNGYRAALDHAQAVAGALTKAGIPVGKITVEAAPASADHRGRVEIRLEH